MIAVFYSSRLDAYFLTIIAGIENTKSVASDFSNAISFFFSFVHSFLVATMIMDGKIMMITDMKRPL